MKFLILLALISSPLFAKDTREKYEFSITKENEGYACMKARGESRRNLAAICEKKKMKINWDNIDISECVTKKLGPGKIKATYTYKYECVEK